MAEIINLGDIKKMKSPLDLSNAKKEVEDLSFMTKEEIGGVLTKLGVKNKDDILEYIQTLDNKAQYDLFLQLLDLEISLFFKYIDSSDKLTDLQRRVLKNIKRIKNSTSDTEFDVARKIVQRDGYYELAKYEKYFKNITREYFGLLKDISDLKSLVNFDLKDKAQIKEEIDQIKKNGFKK